MTSTKPVAKSKTTQNTGGDFSASVRDDLSNSGFSIPFFHYLTIPTNTTQQAPISFVMQLPIGRINRLWVEFPRGCAGLAGVQIHRATRQIFPLPEDVWLKSDNAVMNFALTHAIKQEPYEIIIKGYNSDDTYSHTIWMGFEMSGNQRDLSPELQGLINYLGRG